MTRHDAWKFLDKLRRKSYIKHEIRRTILKSISKSHFTPLAQKYAAHFSLSRLPRQSSRNKIRNRCVVSGRVWNVVRRTQYSRFVLRQQAYSSNLPGARRASW